MIIFEEDKEEDKDIEFHEGETFNSLQLSLCSMAGLTSTNSQKIQGVVQNNSVLVLVDCGVSHSFISQEVVQKLSLIVEDTPSYIVFWIRGLGGLQMERKMSLVVWSVVWYSGLTVNLVEAN